jgi:hypothetical protein
MNACAAPTCASDADCTDQPHGYCASSRHLAGYCGCSYGCMRDSDCAAGSICECGVLTGTCVAETCKTSADCGPGRTCLRTLKASDANSCSLADPATGVVYSCQNPDDACSGDVECSSAGCACRLVDGRRVCGQSFCPI